MKRALVLAVSAACVLALGCGTRSYEFRMNKTLEFLKYRQRLDQYLNPPAEDKLKDLAIYLRPPKPLSLASAFQLTSTPDQFDLEKSFTGGQAKGDSLRLHVLARKKQDTKKKGAAAESAARMPFKDAVFSLLANDYGAAEALQGAKIENSKAKANNYKRVLFIAPSNGHLIRVYLYSQAPYDVALVWDIPPSLSKDATTNEAIALSLESFAVGAKANRQFQAGVGDEESAPAGGEAGGS
ncbi:MAG: hypothetical protein IRY99_11460, partial [Isosphaeraceae bacterium]|nr:hypothetical protein [Isosphaeraceae bacterium]